jgi:stage V sporulation protein R
MAKKSKMLSGSPILMGDNNIPGVKIHKEVQELLPLIFQECRDFGLDYYPTVVEFLTYDEISEIASYGGFPVRYPHWRFGMEYEELSRGYEYGMHRISEMVVNTNPCYIYCLDSNTLVDQIDVIAHALGHNDFFKNNVFFEPTDENMMNKLANHGTRIRKYMARWGKEKVTEFIDHVLRIETLIDPTKAWNQKKVRKAVVTDSRTYRHVKRRKSDHDYMDDWVNPKDYIDEEKKRIEKEDAADYLDIEDTNDRDIFGYIKDHAPLKPWQQDIMSMMYDEAMYFAPQRATKMINEGWASYVDFNIMVRRGLCAAGQKTADSGIIEYAKHKMMVLGGKYSMNPYKLGFQLFMDIEDRWNKGRFGPEYDDCQSLREKLKWNKKLDLGHEKVFEVRKCHNDATLLREYFTPEFCEKNQFFEYKRFPNGEYKIVNRDFKSIKAKLIQRHTNAGLPDIRLTDPDHRGRGVLFLQHYHEGKPLYEEYARETLTSLWRFWKKDIILATRNAEEEIVFHCTGSDPKSAVTPMTRRQYERAFLN